MYIKHVVVRINLPTHLERHQKKLTPNRVMRLGSGVFLPEKLTRKCLVIQLLILQHSR